MKNNSDNNIENDIYSDKEDIVGLASLIDSAGEVEEYADLCDSLNVETEKKIEEDVEEEFEVYIPSNMQDEFEVDVEKDVILEEEKSKEVKEEEEKELTEEVCQQEDVDEEQVEDDIELLELYNEANEQQKQYSDNKSQMDQLFRDVATIATQYDQLVIKYFDDMLWDDKYDLSLCYEYIAIPRNISFKKWSENYYNIVKEFYDNPDNNINPNISLCNIFKNRFANIIGVSENIVNIYSGSDDPMLHSDILSRLRLFLRLLEKNYQGFTVLLKNIISIQMQMLPIVNLDIDLKGVYDSEKREELKRELENNNSIVEQMNKYIASFGSDLYGKLASFLAIANDLKNTYLGLKDKSDDGHIVLMDMFLLIHEQILTVVSELDVEKIELNEGDLYLPQYCEIISTEDNDDLEIGTIVRIESDGYKRVLSGGEEKVVLKSQIIASKHS